MSKTLTPKPSKFQTQSSKQRMEFSQSDFLGINNNDDPASVADNSSPDTLNTVLDVRGSILTRKGYTKILTTSLGSATGGGFAYYKSDGTKQLVFSSGTNLYRYDNAGGQVQIGTTFTGTSWRFDEYNDVLYGATGADPLQSYNGSTIAPLSIGLTPQFIKIHKNRLWAVAPNSSTLYFSNAGDPTTFPANNYIAVNTNDGQVITGLAVLLDSLIVFKNDSIWVITGEPLGSGTTTVIGNLNLRRANSDVGCVSDLTIQKVGPVLLFAHTSGLYVFQNYQSQIISTPVNGTFKIDMNPNFQYTMYAIYSAVEKKYLLGYADNTSTVPNKAICYDLVVKQFTIWDDIPGGWGMTFKFTKQESVVIGDPSKGNMYTLFQGYADIAGDNGTVSGSTSTTLVDSSKAWTTNQFAGCRVQSGLGTGSVSTGTVVSNTSTTLTVASWNGGTPSVNNSYTIGGYNSYWKTKVFDFDAPQMSKRYKYWNLFVDSETNYSLQVGASIDFAPLSFNLPPLSLSSGSVIWDQAGVTWDTPGIYYDSKSSLFKRANLPGQGRFLQGMFGNFNSNQPWRCFAYDFSYKLKKARPT